MPFTSLQDIIEAERVPFGQRVGAASAYDQMAAAAQAAPAATAFTFLRSGAPDTAVETVSYGEFLARVHRMAHLFRADGVGPEDAVAMLLPGAPDTFAAIFAAHLAGRAAPINFLLEPAHIAALLRAARARVLLVPDPALLPGVIDKLPAILAALEVPPRLYRLGGPAEGEIPRLQDAIAGHPDRVPEFWSAPAPDRIAALFHTGGTTSAPKLASHTHDGVLRHCWAIAQVWRDGAEEVYFNGLPPFHVGGGYAAGLMPLTQGAHIVIPTAAGFRNREVVANFWRHVERFRPTFLGMVPTSWGAVLNIPLDGADVSSVRMCHAGGAAMPVELARAVENLLGVQIVEGWGMTELHGFGTMNPAEGECRIGSVGFRMPYTELCVAEIEDGRIARVCPPGQVGRLLARGHQIFSGYLDPAHNAGAWVAPLAGETVPDWSPGGDWLDTGDLARIDEDGYIWLTGRAKDTIIRGGHNIDPLTIEEALYAHPGVEAAAAVGQPDDYAGELPMAFVQLKTGAEASEAELLEFARARIPERAAVPAAIVILGAMPVTAVGKIFKPELRLIAAERVLEARVTETLGGPGAEVRCEMDKRRGMVAHVTLPAGGTEAGRDRVRKTLSGFSFPCEIAQAAS